MTRENSAFRSLCMAQGSEEYNRLLKMAQAARKKA